MLKIENKRRFTAMIGVLIVILGALAWGVIRGVEKYRAQKTSPAETAAKAVTSRGDAQLIAEAFLASQAYAKNYEPTPISVETYPKFWNIWFATVDPEARPNRGLVQVDRETGKASWKELE